MGSAKSYNKSGTVRRNVSPMEYQRGSRVLFYAKTCACVCQTHAPPAAMVFEEAAGTTLELAHLEPLVGSHS